VRVARHPGKMHAPSEAMVITTKAEPKTCGSRGLTLQRRFPSNRVNVSATAGQKHAACRQRQATRHHQAQRIGRAGAERHAQPPLAGALRNCLGHHAIQSDDSEQRR
jgi:hypothetical protein